MAYAGVWLADLYEWGVIGASGECAGEASVGYVEGVVVGYDDSYAGWDASALGAIGLGAVA